MYEAEEGGKGGERFMLLAGEGMSHMLPSPRSF